jgi:hypothetical protein
VIITDVRQPDLTVDPIPGELTAFAKRMAASIPHPFAPTLPLQQGQYTIVIFYEHSYIWEDNPEHPLRLRYGFATLDSDGKTRVMSASEVAHAREPAARAERLVRDMEAAASSVCDDLEFGNKRRARMLVRNGGHGWVPRSKEELDQMMLDDDSPGLRLEVGCPAEFDELFKALSQSGRMAADL